MRSSHRCVGTSASSAFTAFFPMVDSSTDANVAARYGGTEKFHLSGRTRQYPLAAQNVCQATLQRCNVETIALTNHVA